MQPDQAKFLASILIQTFEREHETTRKVIAAVPVDKGDYRPHERSKSALELAWHIPSVEMFFLTGVCGAFPPPGDSRPDNIRTSADVLAWYDEQYPVMLQRVKALTAEQLAAPVDFRGFMTLPAVMFLNMMLMHSVHHRGQLSAYLRPMGAKVPGIYGPSGDEPIPARRQSA
jgi:uncharacterized damage-inducible protein DinB